ncbi:MAG: cysteine desulfurase-like protein [Acidimicrobiia bacterium]|nr:cysteine desulfurase-like protein [Acidimicrobiia bacterium]
MDIAGIRDQFPALNRVEGGRQAIYLDGPAGTQVPNSVIDATAAIMRAGYSNLGGPYDASRLSEATLEAARSAMADLYNASPEEIVFGQNMTSHTFAMSRALAATWDPGDEIVLTRLDHDANVEPWLRVAGEREVTVRWADFHDYALTPEAIGAELGPKTRLVAVGAASNALGTVVDIAAVSRLVRQTDALLYVDAVHYAPHRLIDVRAWDVDFLVASSYKFFGPHIGILYGKAHHLANLPAYKVRPAPDSGPDRWETGTQSFESLAGVTAAVDYLATFGEGETRRQQLENGYGEIAEYEAGLAERFLAGVAELGHVTVHGLGGSGRVSTFSVEVAGLTDSEVAAKLGKQGIYVSNGTYYAVEVMQQLGKAGLVRIGFLHYNTVEEVDAVLSALDGLA